MQPLAPPENLQQETPQETPQQQNPQQRAPRQQNAQLSLQAALEQDLLGTLKTSRKVREVILQNLESLKVRLLSLNTSADKADVMLAVANILNTLTRTAETTAKALKMCKDMEAPAPSLSPPAPGSLLPPPPGQEEDDPFAEIQ